MAPEDRNARARRLGKRYVMGIFVAFAAGFILLCTWEILVGVYGLDAPGRMAAHGVPSEACARVLTAYAGVGLSDSDDPPAPEAVAAACTSGSTSSNANLDAVAATRRYRRAIRGRSGAESATLRRDLEAYFTN